MTDVPATQGPAGKSPRDDKGRFLKGFSGNPNGPRPGFRSLTDRLKEALEANDGYLAKWILAAWIKMVFDGKTDAIKAILDRVEGKLVQPVEATINIEQRIIAAAEREGLDPKEAIETAQRIVKEGQW